MAHIKIIGGPRSFQGREYAIPESRAGIEALMKVFLEHRCFWEIKDFLHLEKKLLFELKIIDFSCRCTRSIFMGIPIYIDGSKIEVQKANKEAVDDALKKIINLLEISGGDMKIISDDVHHLKIESVATLETMAFLQENCFGSA